MEDRLIESKAYRVILLGVIEIIGRHGLRSVLNYSGFMKYADMILEGNNGNNGPRISEVAALSGGIEEIYGKNGARAILFQVGRMQAKLGIEENADVAGAARAAMSGMSDGERTKVILSYTADTISKQLNTRTWVEQDGDDYLYQDEAATHCFNRKSKTPVCYTTAGFVDGLVAWAVGGNTWKVQETACMAMGEAHCSFRVSRQAGE